MSLEEKQTEIGYTPSYDEIIKFLNTIESDELEKKCTPQELERIAHYIAFLAKKGVLPDNSEESLSLDDDIEELLNGDENNFSFESYNDYQYMILPAVWKGQGEIVFCKSWVQKQCKHIKKFVVKHKKELIIGAIVVVAVAAVVVGFENVVTNRVLRQSVDKFRNAEIILKPY